jgi:outer membrane protein
LAFCHSLFEQTKTYHDNDAHFEEKIKMHRPAITSERRTKFGITAMATILLWLLFFAAIPVAGDGRTNTQNSDDEAQWLEPENAMDSKARPHLRNPSEIKIKVLSGDGNIRPARRMAEQLESLGYSVASIDLAPKSNFTQHTIYFSANFFGEAESLAARLNDDNIRLKPLTWPTAFDIILVAVESQSRMEEVEERTETPPPDRKEDVVDLAAEAGALLAEAHQLYAKKDYMSATERYGRLSHTVKSIEKLCASSTDGAGISPQPSRLPETDKNKIRIQVLSKAPDLSPAKKSARQIEKMGYAVDVVDYALRSDIESNTLYFAETAHPQASEIVLGLADDPELKPLRWSSKYDVILVVGEPLDSENGLRLLSKLNAEETRLNEKMSRTLKDAHLLFTNGDSAYARKKCGEMARLIKKAERICEKAFRQAKIDDHMKAPGKATVQKEPGPDVHKSFLTVDEAIRIAINRNALIQEADEKVQSAMEEKKSARAGFFPKAEAGYSYTRLNEAPTTSFSNPFAPFIPGDFLTFTVGSQDTYKWNATLSQPLFTGFALTSQYRLKELKINSAQIEKEMAILDLTRDVKKSYYTLLLVKKVLTVAEDAVDNLKSHERDAQNYYKQGMIPYNDLLKSQVALANVVQQREKTKAGVLMATAALNTLLDYDVNQETQIAEPAFPLPASLQMEDLFHEAMENRPELKLLNLAVKNIDQGIRLVKSAWYPKVGIAGFYEQTGDNPAATENDFGSSYMSAMILKADWVLFEGGKTRADVARYKHEKKAVMKRYESAENAVKLDVKNAFSNLEVSDKNIVTSRESLIQAKENWRITNLQYQEQIATSTDVLDARTFLSQAETNYYSALYGYMIALCDLERALGKKTI